MILAAGRGERMRPLTDATPKPLLEAGGKPLVVWTLERLVRAGIRDVVINHAHLGEQIEAALGDGAHFGARIRYSPEKPALETAGGIAQALPLLGETPFVVVNGDIYCDYDFSRCAQRAERMRAGGDQAHLVLVPNPAQHPYGDFVLEGERTGEGDTGRLTFSGIGLYDPALFAGVAPGSRARLAPLLSAAMAAGRCGGELHLGDWVDVGTPQRLAELDARLAGHHREPTT